jgi:hypothetical protein
VLVGTAGVRIQVQTAARNCIDLGQLLHLEPLTHLVGVGRQTICTLLKLDTSMARVALRRSISTTSAGVLQEKTRMHQERVSMHETKRIRSVSCDPCSLSPCSARVLFLQQHRFHFHLRPMKISQHNEEVSENSSIAFCASVSCALSAIVDGCTSCATRVLGDALCGIDEGCQSGKHRDFLHLRLSEGARV